MLTKARSIEAEKSISTTTHAVTMKSASTTEAGATNQTSELARQMNELITIVKNQQVQNIKSGNKNSSNGYGQDKYKGNNKEGRNLKGPDTNASGPFRNGTSPFQYYKCSGWGHRAFECPLPLNYQRRRILRERREQSLPGENHSVDQNKPNQNTKTSQN